VDAVRGEKPEAGTEDEGRLPQILGLDLMGQVGDDGPGVDVEDYPLHYPHIWVIKTEISGEHDGRRSVHASCHSTARDNGQAKITLIMETPTKITERMIVNWNKVFSRPLLVRPAFWALPNSPLPASLTWARITSTSNTDTII
jgi:hypothetical protein